VIAVPVGLGIGVAGAAILAVGVVNSPRIIAEQAGTYWDYSQPLARAFARDRSDAEIGLAALALGFITQLIGVAWGTGDPSPGLALIAAAIPAGLIAAAWLVIRPRRVERLLARIENERSQIEAEDARMKARVKAERAARNLISKGS